MYLTDPKSSAITNTKLILSGIVVIAGSSLPSSKFLIWKREGEISHSARLRAELSKADPYTECFSPEKGRVTLAPHAAAVKKSSTPSFARLYSGRKALVRSGMGTP